MADYDKDGDAIMTPQHITENEELPQQLATTASRRVNRAVQNSTDTGAISPSVSSLTNVKWISTKKEVACD